MVPHTIRVICSAVSALVVLAAARQAGAQELLGDYHVLAIGIDRYKSNQVSDLSGCANDARAIVALFGGPRARMLLNDRATRANVLKELENLPSGIPERGKVVLFFSGHGYREGGSWYFICHDFRSEEDALPGVPTPPGVRDVDIFSCVDRLTQEKLCDVILILDACFAGEIRGKAEPRFRWLSNPQRGSLVLLASCTGNETSMAGTVHSVFTSALLDGLRGQADLSRDHCVTLSELKRYLAVEVKERLRTSLKAPGVAWPEQDYMAEWSLSVADSLVMANISRDRAGKVLLPRWDMPSEYQQTLEVHTVVNSDEPIIGAWRWVRETEAPGSEKRLKVQLDLVFNKDGTYHAVFDPPFGAAVRTHGRYEFKPGKFLTLIYDNGTDALGVSSLTRDKLVLQMKNNRYRSSDRILEPGFSRVNTYAMERVGSTTAQSPAAARK